MKKQITLFVLFLLCYSVTAVEAQADRELLCRETNFNSTKFFSSFNNTVLNTTRQVLELNYTDGSILYEDFTAYTEYDPSNEISVINSTCIEFLGNFRGSADKWLLKSVNQDNVTGRFAFMVDYIATNAYTIKGSFFQYSESMVDDYIAIQAASQNAVVLDVWSDNTPFFLIEIRETHDGAQTSTRSTNYLTQNTWYYMEYSKTLTAAQLKIYSDPDYSTLIETLDRPIDESWGVGKIMVLNNYGSATVSNLGGYLKDLTFNQTGGYVPSGLAYTSQLIEDNQKAFCVAVNATVPAETRIKISCSDDGSNYTLIGTLTDALNCEFIHLESLNISQLYLRFELETNNSLTTPSVNHLYVLQNIQSTGETTLNETNWMVLVIWLILLILGYAKEKLELKVIGSIIGLVFGIMILSMSPVIAYLVCLLNLVIFLWEISSGGKRR